MLHPKVPINPTPTRTLVPLDDSSVELDVRPTAPVVCQHHAPAPPPMVRGGVHLTAGATVAAIGAGTAAVLVIGAVLVGMFLAISITAGSLAIVALVARSLLNTPRDRD
ncbi:SpdD-like protein [Streptomyces luteoverticillatus]|uniref:SpdD-like protein n=1 Tax=Streptomyces luteoverticillatus TaxID=66425 RepID=A0A3S9PK40_STRLT|nr:SpdD-like protein [Streptomyces luteoverticillatus]AZQ72713.1 SpdD-like protein [Streptomyces luteoverticillatus]